jgi:6-phosphogluconolactonase
MKGSGTNKMNIKKYELASDLNIDFANEIAAKLTQGIAENGRASLLVSGGSTPRPLFAVLSDLDIEWQNVDISLVDDRWVDADDDASNEKMVKEALLINKASSAQFFGLKTPQTDAFAAVEEVKKNLADIQTPFDVVILGMGEDGHTASIFPCCEQLDEGLNTTEVLLATQPTTAPHQRMTFSKTALLNSKQLYLHLVGANKETVLEKVLEGTNEKEAPIRAFLQQRDVPITIMFAKNK